MNEWIGLAAFIVTGLAGLALNSNLIFFSAPIVAIVVSVALRILRPRNNARS
jgi:hypothetical protein